MASLEQRLRDAGNNRRTAETERLAAASLLHRLVREAARKGWTKTRIAEVAGIARQTVHDILRDD
jgi:DNA-binding XRE family transcriptional regulator